MVEFIKESGIMLAMVGLLTALPNTQLTRRLARERRLIGSKHDWITDPNQSYELQINQELDQTIGGLNFVTQRDRVEIYRELRSIITQIYSPQAFLDRVMDTTSRIQIHNKHVPNWWEFKRMLRGFFVVVARMLGDRRTRWLYLRNVVRLVWMGPPNLSLLII